MQKCGRKLGDAEERKQIINLQESKRSAKGCSCMKGYDICGQEAILKFQFTPVETKLPGSI